MRSTGIDAIWVGAASSTPIRLVYRGEPTCIDERARPGSVVAQRYELECPLGGSSDLGAAGLGAASLEAASLAAAGLGAFWHALDLRRGYPVTLQLLDPAIAEDPEILESFFDEARAAATIIHPNVAQVLDSGVDAGVPFLALERLEGESLASRLRTRGRLSPAELAQLFREIAGGVEAMHGWGVVHRRLDPEHLFLTRDVRKSAAGAHNSLATSGSDESAKVLVGIDGNLAEGLSLLRQLSDHMSGQARQDLGWELELQASMSAPPDTTAYQSPEQLLGHAPIDKRSDLWSLAVIAFEALTGRPAFEGPSNGERLIQICSGSPSEVPAHVPLPAGFAPWFQKAVSRSSCGRFGSAREMAQTLSDVLEG